MNRREFTTGMASAVSGAALISQIGCGNIGTISTPTALLAGVEAAVETIQALLNLNPEENAWITTALSFIASSATELQSTDTLGEKALKIGSAFTAATLASLPKGAPFEFTIALAALNAFLSALGAPSSIAPAMPLAATTIARSAKPSSSEIALLSQMKARTHIQ